MPIDTSVAWFGYELHGGQPSSSATTSDMAVDDANLSPVAHILDRYTYRQWQSPSEDDWFQIDFGADVSIQFLCVVFPRIEDPRRRSEVQEILPTDQIHHWLDADGGTPGAGAVFNSGLINCEVNPRRGYHVLALETEVVARTWRCRVNAISRASEGFFLVMLADAGPLFQPSFNHIYGEKLGFPDNSEAQRTPTSQVSFITRNARTLQAQLLWDFVPDDERTKWEAMDEYAGMTEPVVFAVANKTPIAVAAVTGPNAWIMQSDKAFVGMIESDLSIVSRDLNANIKQIQLTEHR